MSLVLGIDTGGTYTDGVILDLNSQQIVTKAKALTTRENLAVGIRNCITALNHEDYRSIKIVSLSTTLATNAIVEGRGCEVGLLLIGHEPIGKLPVQHYAVLQGGHDIKGRMNAELDFEAVRLHISQLKGKVGAVAISGYLSIRNPEHELAIRQLVEEMLEVPVVCAHQLTTTLGFHERTVTAALNARLIPIIAELLESVKSVLQELEIDAPLMIVKGDGSLMSETLAREKPIDTILSGPAASIIGATYLSDAPEALVLDMGGTTTDIAILQEGVPRLNKEGAVVGGWLTRVQAAEINTYGIGGDSYLQITKDRQLAIGPQRVWPLAVVAAGYPYLMEELQEYAGYDWELLFAQATDCLMLLKQNGSLELTEMEKELVELLRSGPHSIFYLADRLGRDPNLFNPQHLINTGVLARISVTPTDILHARGEYTSWNREAAVIGVQMLADRMGKAYDAFVNLAMDSIVNSLSLAVVQSIANYEGYHLLVKEDAGMKFFLDKILGCKEPAALECAVRLKFPIIAIGAPVKAYLPRVAAKLNSKLIIPDHAEVANAIGAATGKVMETIKILVKPGAQGFIVHAPWERKTYMYMEDAVSYALEAAKQQAAIAAEKAGAADYQLMVQHQDIFSSTNTTWQQEIYVETRIEVTAVGRPRWEVGNI